MKILLVGSFLCTCCQGCCFKFSLMWPLKVFISWELSCLLGGHRHWYLLESSGPGKFWTCSQVINWVLWDRTITVFDKRPRAFFLRTTSCFPLKYYMLNASYATCVLLDIWLCCCVVCLGQSYLTACNGTPFINPFTLRAAETGLTTLIILF